MTRTDKKKKKKKKTRESKEQVHDTHADTDRVSIKVSLDTQIAQAAGTAGGGYSWTNVFAAAATIQPEELDEEYLSRTENTVEKNDGLAQIARLAQQKGGLPGERESSSKYREDGRESLKRKGSPHFEQNQKKAKGNSYEDDEPVVASTSTDGGEQEEDEESDISLEGQMISHPSIPGETVMVLMDKKRSLVYSAMERTEEGDLIQIGTIRDGNVVFDGAAFFGDNSAAQADEDKAEQISFPFPTDPDDHCESPVESYKDIVPFLKALCQARAVREENLAIYDPYYCARAVVQNFASLGFYNVHNEKRDCYKVWETGVHYPKFDALITNPPYSGNHIESLLRHVTDRNFGENPWLLLLPTWVHKKDYYKRLCSRVEPFYLVPNKRYVYLPPKHFRQKKASDVHKKSSPFVSMWYIWGGTRQRNQEWINLHNKLKAKGEVTCELARSRSALRDLRRKGKKR